MNRSLAIAGPLLAASLLLFLAACDATSATPDAESADLAIASSELSDLTNGLAEDLDLSDAEKRVFRAAAAQHERRYGQPGFLWYVAAGLQERLSEEQKERLFARLDEAAGGFRDRRHRRDERRERALDRLNLSDAQRDALRALREDYEPQFHALIEARQNGDLTEEAFREEMHALREAMHAEIGEVLTPEQRAQLDRWRNRHQERRERVGEWREESRAVMIEVLDLTEEQMDALRNLRETQQAERRALFAAARDGEMDRQALPEALRALRQSGEGALAEIVTTAQLETMKLHRVLVRFAAARIAKGRRGSRG